MERENQLFSRQVRALWPEVLHWLQTSARLAGGCRCQGHICSGRGGASGPSSELSVIIVFASYVSLSTLCFYKHSLLLEAKYSVRNSARPS